MTQHFNKKKLMHFYELISGKWFAITYLVTVLNVNDMKTFDRLTVERIQCRFLIYFDIISLKRSQVLFFSPWSLFKFDWLYLIWFSDCIINPKVMSCRYIYIYIYYVLRVVLLHTCFFYDRDFSNPLFTVRNVRDNYWSNVCYVNQISYKKNITIVRYYRTLYHKSHQLAHAVQ